MPFIKQALETAIGKLGEAGLEVRNRPFFAEATRKTFTELLTDNDMPYNSVGTLRGSFSKSMTGLTGRGSTCNVKLQRLLLVVTRIRRLSPKLPGKIPPTTHLLNLVEASRRATSGGSRTKI